MEQSLADLRQAAREAAAAEQPSRRVYNLPISMVARILRYQARECIKSETEAARQLLDQALTAWEAL